MSVSQQQQFTLLSRLLHWLMAALILAMLFIGIGMVASLADYVANRRVSVRSLAAL